ncbi:MAG TPA: hypothetical protein VJV79_29880 [Polyangiaceae bacterium]|nr:hypothetical protein [Polyangiaceae bacterium]
MTTSHDDETADGTKNTGNHGRWDPFKTFRRFLAPEERMELLQVKRPVLPPEDFMNTVELERLRSTRFRAKLRYLSPALIGLGTFLIVGVAAVLWCRPWSSSSVSPAPAAAPAAHNPVPTPQGTGSDSISSVIAQASRPSSSSEPSRGVLLPTHSAKAPRHPSPPATAARVPLKTLPTAPSAAPKAQKHTPEGLDLDTPMAPPVH